VMTEAFPAATTDLTPLSDATASTSQFERKILRAAASVTVAGIVVKMVAALKEMIVAGVYGRSDAMDAFLAAFLIPNLLVNVIAESMNQVLMPTLVRVRLQQGQAKARELLAHSMMRVVLLLGVVCAVMGATARIWIPLIGWSFPAAKIELCVRIFWVLLPTVVLTGIATNCTAVLNTLERFALPAFAPVLVPLSVAAGAYGLYRQLGIWAMVYFSIIGTIVQVAVLAWSMERCGYPLRFSSTGPTKAAAEVTRQYGPVLLSSVVASGGLLLDQAMAA